jgi:hypothetical protein
LDKNSETWLAISAGEEQKEGEAKKEVSPIEVPVREGRMPWAYFLYGGSPALYHADLENYGPEYTKDVIIYWPKQYQKVTHIYLKKGIVLAIY